MSKNENEYLDFGDAVLFVLFFVLIKMLFSCKCENFKFIRLIFVGSE